MMQARNWLDQARQTILEMLPHSLLGRSILIIVMPIVLLQIVLAWVFYSSHWDTVTKRLAQSVAGDIAMMIRLMPDDRSQAGLTTLFALADEEMELDLYYSPGEILPNDPTVTRENLVDRRLAIALDSRVGRPFIIDSRSLEKQIEIHVQLADGVLHTTVARKRLFSSTTYVFFIWMVGISWALLVAATLFMRTQVRPIKRLAQAADEFGKGVDYGDFSLVGAREVVLAGHAFNQMRERIRRQISQRTEMLAGVSHDLRTPLTRMNLQLAMLRSDDAIEGLKKDVNDMARMIEGYLAFARGEGGEQTALTNLLQLIHEAVGDARRHGAIIEFTGIVTTSAKNAATATPEKASAFEENMQDNNNEKMPTPAHGGNTSTSQVGWAGEQNELWIPLKRGMFRRCLQNLIGNAEQYGSLVRVSVERTKGKAQGDSGNGDSGGGGSDTGGNKNGDGNGDIYIHIDDNGPGIPEEKREDVFRPFFRLDESRNSETGGTGLGLTIARDVARSHGGDLILSHSPNLGGLRATLRLPG